VEARRNLARKRKRESEERSDRDSAPANGVEFYAARPTEISFAFEVSAEPKHQRRGGLQRSACCPPALYPSKQLLYLSSEQLPTVALLFALPQLACQLRESRWAWGADLLMSCSTPMNNPSRRTSNRCLLLVG